MMLRDCTGYAKIMYSIDDGLAGAEKGTFLKHNQAVTL
jgi:hypothetical protein